MEDHDDIRKLLTKGENLTVEFKSDKKCLPDRDLIAATMALANTEGGDLLLGVEDDGTITGLHKNHLGTSGIAVLIANRTTPSLTVQAVPFYPHEFTQRQSSLGLLDPSAAVQEMLSEDDHNPLERERIREMINRYGGDKSLLGLEDQELDGALGLTITVDGVRRPTMAGLLLLGREMVLRQHLPAHETAFQVLQGTDVRVNEFFRRPLLKIFEDVEQLFSSWVVEKEFQVGLFRVPVPNFDRLAFREAFVNALIHRDYARLGAVHVRIDDNGLTISNPGGFVEGVTLDNLLVTEPRSRNPLLADIAKRIGLAERTGRGIDRIYSGLLRYGRPAPDYSRSDTSSVILCMSNVESDMDFLELIIQEENRQGGSMPLDSLIILSQLRQERRVSINEIASSLQKSEQDARRTIEKLTEAGLAEAYGTGRGRTYILSAELYQKIGQKAGYVRQAGFDPIQQEQMVLNYIDKHGTIKRAETMELCRITKDQAYKLLTRMKKNGHILRTGTGKGTVYR